MRHFLTLALALLLCLRAMAQGDSSDLRISVLTCSQGSQIYSVFGHSAFRARSQSRHVDRVYNYGTFNYQQPYFALKFARGYLDYALTAYSYRLFCMEYIKEGRQVMEQDLNLTSSQAQAVFDFLEWNSMEENRYYRYNFLLDNCATKIRDVIEQSCGQSVKFADTTLNFTLRESINSMIGSMPWFRLAISLAMGLPADATATSRSAMFLPGNTFEALARSSIERSGASGSLVLDTRMAVPGQPRGGSPGWLERTSPSLAFWLMLAAWGLATLREARRGTYAAWADRMLLCTAGFLGAVIFALWFMSEHTVCAGNLNILWLWPSHLVAAWKTRSPGPFWSKYFKAAAIASAAMAAAGPLLPQQYDPAFYPMLLILALRLGRIGFLNKK